MLNKYIRYFNQNRLKVFVIAFIIILAMLIIQALNSYLKELNQQELKNIENRVELNLETKPAISSGEVNTKQAIENEKLIQQFVTYCNLKDTQKAYELLSDDCKTFLFPTQQDFIKNYYNIIFTNYKDYAIEVWISEGNLITYKIRYTNDALADGGYKGSETIEDYYTIVKNGDDYKLNINKLVNVEKTNTKLTNDNFSITILTRENYIDYQIYEVQFDNESDFDVKIYDTIANSKWCIIDQNDREYSAFLEEIADSNLQIRSKGNERLKIKYAKMYNPERKITKINFENMYFIKGNEGILFSISSEN